MATKRTRAGADREMRLVASELRSLAHSARIVLLETPDATAAAVDLLGMVEARADLLARAVGMA